MCKNRFVPKTSFEKDPVELRKIKGLIRKGEAKATCKYVGIPMSQVHFLDLPFYETGLIEKKPLSQEDIDIIIELLKIFLILIFIFFIFFLIILFFIFILVIL